MEKRIILTFLVMMTILAATAAPVSLQMTAACHGQAIMPTGKATTAAPLTQWNKTYGGIGRERAYSVQQTLDGGYIVAGDTNSSGKGGYDFWLVKTDSAGNQQWNRTHGGTGDDYVGSIQQTSDGGYIVGGDTRSFGAGESDFWLVKTDSSGNEEWNRTYGGTDYELGYSVQQTCDSGYIIAGFTFSFGAGEGDIWLVKTNSSGGQQWNRTYGGPHEEEGYSVQQTSDGGYIVAGSAETWGTGETDFWLVKTDSAGHQQWNRTYGKYYLNWAYSVQQTSDGGYVVTGETNSNLAKSDLWLVKTDSSGNEQWNKTYGGTGNDWANSVQQTPDNGYIIAGGTNSSGRGGYDFWLVKTDSAGNEQWDKTYGGIHDEDAFSIQQTSDGGYVVAGWTNSFGAGSYDFWLVKTGEGTPPSTITDLAAGSPTSNSVNLTWTAPGDDGMRGNVTAYVVKYSSSGPIDSSNWNLVSTYGQSWTPAMNGTVETHTITGLTAGTKYWFAVQAYDDVPNYSIVSNSPSATTTSTTSTSGETGPGIPLTIIVAGVAVAAAVMVFVAVLLMKKRKPSQDSLNL